MHQRLDRSAANVGRLQEELVAKDEVGPRAAEVGVPARRARGRRRLLQLRDERVVLPLPPHLERLVHRVLLNVLRVQAARELRERREEAVEVDARGAALAQVVVAALEVAQVGEPAGRARCDT